jgi:hypothetical protein
LSLPLCRQHADVEMPATRVDEGMGIAFFQATWFHSSAAIEALRVVAGALIVVTIYYYKHDVRGI